MGHYYIQTPLCESPQRPKGCWEKITERCLLASFLLITPLQRDPLSLRTPFPLNPHLRHFPLSALNLWPFPASILYLHLQGLSMPLESHVAQTPEST